MFNQSAERFTEVMQGMKQMAAEMQQELETTRAELRRGVLELPQETAESAAQMRRVIVDQIEALAELNRIVARHGRSLDTAEPAAAREPRPAYCRAAADAPAGNAADAARPPRRSRPHRRRGDITGAPPRRPEQPPLRPAIRQRRRQWPQRRLAQRSVDPRLARGQPADCPARPRDAARGEERPPRDGVDSLDLLAVDVARMIDHEAAAELWERYKRGERGIFTRRLYTPRARRRSTRSAASTAPIPSSGRPWSTTSTSSSACSTTSRAATAARPWRATTSRRTPARSTPCWRTPPGGSTSSAPISLLPEAATYRTARIVVGQSPSARRVEKRR